MQPISDDMITTSKICVVVTKCEWAMTKGSQHNSMVKSMYKKEMAAPPDEFVALQVINALKVTIPGQVLWKFMDTCIWYVIVND